MRLTPNEPAIDPMLSIVVSRPYVPPASPDTARALALRAVRGERADREEGGNDRYVGDRVHREARRRPDRDDQRARDGRPDDARALFITTPFRLTALVRSAGGTSARRRHAGAGRRLLHDGKPGHEPDQARRLRCESRPERRGHSPGGMNGGHTAAGRVLVQPAGHRSPLGGLTAWGAGMGGAGGAGRACFSL